MIRNYVNQCANEKYSALLNDFSSIPFSFVYNSKFYNNTFSELFKVTSNNFIEVENNDYLDNNLKSYIDLDYSNIGENVTINWSIKTNDVYNKHNKWYYSCHHPVIAFINSRYYKQNQKYHK